MKQNVTPQSNSNESNTEEVVGLSYCPECGSKLTGKEAFCTNCGADIDQYRPESNSEYKSPQMEEDQNKTFSGLVLVLDNESISVQDGDRVGTEIRRALIDSGIDQKDARLISREHLEFYEKDDGYYMTQIGTNSTRLNGHLLEEGNQIKITDGDSIEIADVAELTVEIEDHKS